VKGIEYKFSEMLAIGSCEPSDLLFYHVELGLFSLKRDANDHAEPFSHLFGVREDKDGAVGSGNCPTVLHLFYFVGCPNAPDGGLLVHAYSLPSLTDPTVLFSVSKAGSWP